MTALLSDILATLGMPCRVEAAAGNHASHADVVLTGEGLLDAHATALSSHPAIVTAEYVTKARSINLVLHDSALFDLPQLSMHVLPCERMGEGSDDVLRYAAYRASKLAMEPDAPHDAQAARKLVVALHLFALRLSRIGDESAWLVQMQRLADAYHDWHETYLHEKAAKIRKTNTDLMQKEAIQSVVSSALLARASAMALAIGLTALNINPAKEWVA